jgi:hypothetical protein
MRRFGSSLVALFMAIALALPAQASEREVTVSLSGSPTSMVRQNRVARTLDYDFVQTSDDIDRLVGLGDLVSLRGNSHYVVLKGVSHPFARAELRLFVERLAEQYHEGTGEKLVVTSLTRPVSEQPRNSHQLSVHPAGIAVDLRVSELAKSRRWLESVLLKLERQGLLDITRERRPPHYHIAPATVSTPAASEWPHWSSLLAVIAMFVTILGAWGIFAQDALRKE